MRRSYFDSSDARGFGSVGRQDDSVDLALRITQNRPLNCPAKRWYKQVNKQHCIQLQHDNSRLDKLGLMRLSDLCRAGLRHVRGVRPNRAAKFRAQFRTLQKLTGQFERLWMMYIRRKLPQIPDSTWAAIGFHFATYCNGDQRTKNSSSVRPCVLKAFNTAKCDCSGGPPRTPLEKLTASPRSNPWGRYSVSRVGPAGPLECENATLRGGEEEKAGGGTERGRELGKRKREGWKVGTGPPNG